MIFPDNYLLSSIQLSIKKEGNSPIAVNTARSQPANATYVSSLGLCFKPDQLDGTVLVVKGNKVVVHFLLLILT